METSFDPYQVWLQIPPDQQPPDHYRLLGLPRGEPNPAVIALAGQRQMAYLRAQADGPHAELAQNILNQVARASACLMNPARKARYDAALAAGLVADREPPEAPQAGAAAPSRLASPPAAVYSAWVVGSDAACEVVVQEPTVSHRHCRFTHLDGGYFLEDLDSRNGTFLNGRKVTSRVAVCPADAIHLGRHVALAWPAAIPASSLRLIRVGAAPDNDLILDFPMISWHHAVVRVDGDTWVLEDLASTNGTYLGTPGNRVRRARISKDDLLYFGTYPVPASQLLKALTTGKADVP
jgi:pSer/pThr/pTyr-binding forkhead associated (FHA) protein